MVARLAALFALDSLGEGFAVQSFLVFFLAKKFGLSADTLRAVFFAVGFLRRPRWSPPPGSRSEWGCSTRWCSPTCRRTYSLAAAAIAPTALIAIALVLARFALSQMDVPTRQAYVVELVDPDERVAAAEYTATARYAVRPIAPVLGGALHQVSLGLPLLVAGGIKTAYDVALWSWFRQVSLPDHPRQGGTGDLVPAHGPGPGRPTPAVPGIDQRER